MQGVPGDSVPPNTLVCYRDALLAKDWPLAWSVAPVLPEWALPPTFTWPGLGLRSPPVFATIARHLHQVRLARLVCLLSSACICKTSSFTGSSIHGILFYCPTPRFGSTL